MPPPWIGLPPDRNDLLERTHDAAQLGVATHRLIALCCLLSAEPSAALVDAVARRHVGRHQRPAERLALTMGSVTLAASYFARFRLPGSTLAAVEEVCGSTRLDLLWHLPNRTFVADEIKTGLPHPLRDRTQAHDQALAGRQAIGSAFAGVRIVYLRSATGPEFVPPPEEWPT